MSLSPAQPVRYSGAWTKPSLRHLLEATDTFVTCVELVTSRGLITERNGRQVLALSGDYPTDGYQGQASPVFDTDSVGLLGWKDFAREILFSQPDEFFFFDPDPPTGLSSTAINQQYLRSKSPQALKDGTLKGTSAWTNTFLERDHHAKQKKD